MKIRVLMQIVMASTLLLLPQTINAQWQIEHKSNDSLHIKTASKRVHQIGIEYRPGYIFPTNNFLKGVNRYGRAIELGYSAHLKYSFKFKPGSCTDQIYSGVYQGIGLGYFSFRNKEEMGNPIAVYLFQGARIARFSKNLSLDYEWNFGLSLGWKPFDEQSNRYNEVIGSEANAYINAGLQLNWAVCRGVNLVAGVSCTHFSNGNTHYPNSGLNTIGLKTGIVCNINQPKETSTVNASHHQLPAFQPHLSYDLTLFGAWRRKGVAVDEGMIASPNAYTVAGFNFAPMYNVGYRFRTGVSIDGVYDASANVYTIPGNGNECYNPPLHKQLALGMSGRAEYVMPYFTVGVGIGANVLHGGGDHKGIYQVLSLKIETTRTSYLHIGYNLKNFSDPNYLMLGFGFRFNSKYSTAQLR